MNAGIKNKLTNRLMSETVNQLMNISINGPTMFVEENEQMALTSEAAAILERAKLFHDSIQRRL